MGNVRAMKPFLALLALSLACHAQSLKWQLSTPIEPTWNVTNSIVVPDGTGGAAVLITIVNIPQNTNLARVVWVSARGTLNASHDFVISETAETTNRASAQAHYQVFRSNTGQLSDEQIATDAVIDAFFAAPPVTGYNILRVTPKVLDVQTPTSIVRFAKGASKELPLGDFEKLATVPQPVPDKRGFFTVQTGQTNLTIRRYRF